MKNMFLILFLFVSGVLRSQAPEFLPTPGNFILATGDAFQVLRLDTLNRSGDTLILNGLRLVSVVHGPTVHFKDGVKIVRVHYDIEIINGYVSYSATGGQMIKRLKFYNTYQVRKEGAETRPFPLVLPLKNSILYAIIKNR